MAKCIHCTLEIKEGAKFCSKCGKPQATGEKTQVELVQAIEKPPPAETKIKPTPIQPKPLRPFVAPTPAATNGHTAAATTQETKIATPTTAAIKPTSTPKSKNKEYQSAIKDKRLYIPKKVLDALGITGDAPITFIVSQDKTVTIKVGKTEAEE